MFVCMSSSVDRVIYGTFRGEATKMFASLQVQVQLRVSVSVGVQLVTACMSH